MLVLETAAFAEQLPDSLSRGSAVSIVGQQEFRLRTVLEPVGIYSANIAFSGRGRSERSWEGNDQ